MTGKPYDSDPEKEAENFRKHRVTFDDGFQVMAQPPERLLTLLDQRWAYREDRWVAIGAHPSIPSLILHVTYVWCDERPRLISARRATARERRQHANRHR